MAKFKFVEWLVYWLEETSHFEFDWDEGNQTKSAAKHDATTAETEEVFHLGLTAPLGEQISPQVKEERLGVVGTTASGRILCIVFVIRAGKVRPISTRPAKRNERKYYEDYLRESSP